MKRASFRLQPVLDLRRTEERAAGAAAARAASTAADADRRATDYETALGAAVLPPSLQARDFVLAMTLMRTAATDAADARSLATAQAEQSELVRAEWTAAAQRTKGMEKLKERHQMALQLAENAAEERAVDDLVTGRAGRRRGADADGDAHASEEVPWTE